jgi:hypothetical protein
MRVFLCHSSHDKPAVRELYQKLTSDGFDVWFDEEKLLPGQDWNREIIHAVRNANIVIVCLSQSSTTKIGYIQKEIKLILEAADERPDGVIFIIPARLEDCTVPDRLSRFHRVDLYKPDGYNRLIKALRFTEERKEEVSNVAFVTNTKVEAGIPKIEPVQVPPTDFLPSLYIPLAQEEKGKEHPPLQITVVLRSSGDKERDKRRIKSIYGTLISYHGRDRFSFQIYENGKGHLIDFVNDTTRVCTELLERLKKLMGEDSWRVEEIQFK